MNKVELFKDMDELWDNYLQVRATYPYVRPDHVGQIAIESAPYYKAKGLNFRIDFERPITIEDVVKLQKLGYWINQSFIVRLYALLEYYKVISETINIKKDFEGSNELDILRRLRKYFAHTGRYNEMDKDQKKLFDRIVNHFKLEVHDLDNLPIPIDKVIEVILHISDIIVPPISLHMVPAISSVIVPLRMN